MGERCANCLERCGKKKSRRCRRTCAGSCDASNPVKATASPATPDEQVPASTNSNVDVVNSTAKALDAVEAAVNRTEHALGTAAHNALAGVAERMEDQSKGNFM